jgi:iron complex outermembrane recepter protein
LIAAKELIARGMYLFLQNMLRTVLGLRLHTMTRGTMKRLFIAFLLLIISTSFISAQTAGKISGTVYLGSDDTVLHQVSVKLVELKMTTVTDTYGHFQFANVPPGQYTVTAHQEGFRDASQKIDIGAGADKTADFHLQIAGVKENVTVTASGSEQSTLEAIETVSSVDSSQIVARAAVGLGDVLDNEAGVAKRSSGPGTSRPVIRGFDGDRVMVSTDGVSVGSLASQSGDHSEPVDTLSVERIEVVKGPATLLYGSSAIGGVVNAISGHDEGAHPGFRGYLSGIGGTNNAQGAASGGLEYGVGGWMLWGNASAQRTGNYKAGGDFGTVENTFTRNATDDLGFGYFAKKAFFNTNYNYYQNRYGIPLDFRETDPELRSIRMHRNDVKFNFGYNDTDWFVSGIKFTVDVSRYQHQEIADDVVGTTFRNNVFSYRGMFEQKREGKLSGRFGFEGFHRDYSTVGDEILIDGPVAQNSFSVFGLEELKFERASFQFGGRVENNNYDPVNPALIDRDFTGVSAAAGARFDLWKGGAFVANYSHSYRAAAIEELYNNGPHDGTLSFEIGNSALKPEISNGIDLSLRHQNARLKAEANYYYYSFNDFIFLAPTGNIDPASNLPIARYLQGGSRFTGTELSLDVTAHKYVNIVTALDYVNAQLKTGQPLPRISPLRARFGLEFHRGGLSVKPEFVAVERQDRVFTNETPTAGYGTANVTGSYIISQKHMAHVFTVSGYNLNNKLYFNHISFIKDISPEIGRGVRFSYTVRFF